MSELPKYQDSNIVAVVGASVKKDRYSNKAVRLLREYGYQVIPVHPNYEMVEDIPVVPALRAVTNPVHTLSMYVNPSRAMNYLDEILELKPGRVIFNPGAESDQLENELEKAGIPTLRACTLVLLRTGQFERKFS